MAWWGRLEAEERERQSHDAMPEGPGFSRNGTSHTTEHLLRASHCS